MYLDLAEDIENRMREIENDLTQYHLTCPIKVDVNPKKHTKAKLITLILFSLIGVAVFVYGDYIDLIFCLIAACIIFHHVKHTTTTDQIEFHPDYGQLFYHIFPESSQSTCLPSWGFDISHQIAVIKYSNRLFFEAEKQKMNNRGVIA